MQALIQFFSGIAEAVTTAIDFLAGLIEDLVYMVQLLGEVIVDIPNYLRWLPPSIISVFVAIFSLVVIYKILGREG